MWDGSESYATLWHFSHHFYTRRLREDVRGTRTVRPSPTLYFTFTAIGIRRRARRRATLRPQLRACTAQELQGRDRREGALNLNAQVRVRALRVRVVPLGRLADRTLSEVSRLATSAPGRRGRSP